MSDTLETCGCTEHRSSLLTRRTLFRLTAATGLVTATTAHDARVAFAAPSPSPDGSPSAPPSPSTSPSVPASAPAPPATTRRGTGPDVLVVVSLRGGFDGLSAVVPVADPGYRAARPDLALPASALKQVDARFGLAPAMAALYPLWDSGRLAAVHAVGQEDPTRSHFEAMAEMERAAPGSSLRTGWIDRSIGLLGSDDAFAAAQVGSTTMPGSLYGPNPKFAVQGLRDVRVGVDEELVPLSAWTRSIATLHAGARPTVSKPVTDALSAVGSLRQVPEGPQAKAAGYPGGGLGEALHDVAQLVRADLGLRFATVDFGGWDMHENLGGPDGGQMFNRLTELSEALAAFAAELGDDLDRVTVVTLSEFGRRVAQNGSRGLDHGHGNAVLLLGGGVVGGKVHGRWPGLAPDALDSGDLAATTDYRAIMGEVLTKRCGLSGVGSVFPGFSGAAPGVVRAV